MTAASKAVKVGAPHSSGGAGTAVPAAAAAPPEAALGRVESVQINAAGAGAGAGLASLPSAAALTNNNDDNNNDDNNDNDGAEHGVGATGDVAGGGTKVGVSVGAGQFGSGVVFRPIPNDKRNAQSTLVDRGFSTGKGHAMIRSKDKHCFIPKPLPFQ